MKVEQEKKAAVSKETAQTHLFARQPLSTLGKTAKRKVRESRLVLVSCLLDCRQCSAAIRDCFFRDHVTITGGVSRYHRQEKLDALLWCAMLFHDGLSLLDHSSHFVYRSSYWQ